MGLFGKKKSEKANAVVVGEGKFVNFPLAEAVGTFYGNINDNDLIRACVHTNATHTSKAVARVIRNTDEGLADDAANLRFERLLKYNPNYTMTGRDLLYRMRALYELNGVSYTLIDRAPNGAPVGLYPIAAHGTAIENKTGKLLGYSFNLRNGNELLAPIGDLVIIKKSQSTQDYYADDNTPLRYSLGMLDTADKSLKNAVNLSSRLRGILQSSDSILDPDDVKKSRDAFVKDYLAMEDGSGIAALDASTKFTPVSMSPTTANAAQVKIYESRVMRYFGTNDSILMNDYTDAQWIAYYQGSIEPFLTALSLEMTNKCFTERERGFGNEILYESNRLKYASNQTKLQLSAQVDRGVLTLNEYREILGYAPVPGGDVRVIRKEYMGASDIENKEETKDVTKT